MYFFAALLGLIFGSFANVLIHRLPKMLLEQEERGDAACETAKTPYNIATPASHCPACSAPLRWFHNIPLLSYLFLRGRCAVCGVRISPRYPLVEALGGALMLLAFVRYGAGVHALVWGLVWIAFLALLCIDWDYYLLPDAITLPLVWAGVLYASLAGLGVSQAFNVAVNAVSLVALEQSVWGAALGYSSLFLVHYIFKWLRGVEGMGHGDFKLLAALGAWLGVKSLLPILLIASFMGVVAGLLLLRFGGQSAHRGEDIPESAIAFGPYLVLAGFAVWLFPSVLGLVYGY